jgi:hypothetical protein
MRELKHLDVKEELSRNTAFNPVTATIERASSRCEEAALPKNGYPKLHKNSIPKPPSKANPQ